MNERIQELIQKMDWEEMGHNLWGKTHDGCMTTYALKKFAELIVQECLMVINQPNGVGDDDVIRISDDVKKHFGVE